MWGDPTHNTPTPPIPLAAPKAEPDGSIRPAGQIARRIQAAGISLQLTLRQSHVLESRSVTLTASQRGLYSSPSSSAAKEGNSIVPRSTFVEILKPRRSFAVNRHSKQQCAEILKPRRSFAVSRYSKQQCAEILKPRRSFAVIRYFPPNIP